MAIFHSEAFLKSRLSSTAPALAIHYLLLMKLYDKEEFHCTSCREVHIESLLEKSVIFAVFDKKLLPLIRIA